MGREELLYNRLVEGFNLPPIAARAVVNLSMDVLLDDNKTPGGLGQIRYIAISEAEGPGKKIMDSAHKEVVLTLDAPEDRETYQEHDLQTLRRQVILRITHEAKDQGALLTVKDLVRLLKVSYSSVKRCIKALRLDGFPVPIRGSVKDIGPMSHKAKIVELYVKGYTETEIRRNTEHSLRSIERYIIDFSKVLVLKEKGMVFDTIRQIVGLSERVTRDYLSLIEVYNGQEYKDRLREISGTVKAYTPPATFKKTGVIV
jgi:hypothetical protein